MKPFLLFDKPHLEIEFEKLHIKLQATIYLYALFMWINFKIETVVTSVFRPEDPKSVHCDFRGCDLRTRNIPEARIIAAVDYVNTCVTYDPKRPDLRAMVYRLTGEKAKKFGDHKDHVHGQVHPRTIITLGGGE